MNKILLSFFRSSLLLIAIFIGSQQLTFANHIFGADLYYTYVSGNTYTVYFVVYGDCAGTNFGSLSGSSPQVEVYNGSTLFTTLNLSIQNPSNGVEVTPVCPSQLNNTTCNGGSITGVKKFTYSTNVTLNTTSANWRFHFNDNMGGGYQAGRSATITNISNSNNTLITLDALLNNINGSNSSSINATIPTPFFCINKPANYNPAAIDPNNDSLAFYLVPGADGSTGSSVNYISPYTATNPLAVSSGTFAFSSNNGQLAFTPNLVQNSLVVYNTEEYRNGVLVGTSQREMTFVVVNTCNNNPPTGTISNYSGTGILTANTITVCQNTASINFNINPSDPDGNNINVTTAGIPVGATFNITNNGTTAPICTFSWNTASIAPGSYNFFLTFQDDGCPLSSKQTIAYTIVIVPNPKYSFSLVSAATCTKKAVFTLTPTVAPAPWTYSISQGSSNVQTLTNITGIVTDSLLPGIYTIRIYNSGNCYMDSMITLAAPNIIHVSASATNINCYGANNGVVVITASGGLGPFNYAQGAGTYTSSNTFNNLPIGTYTFHVKDANNCIKDTSITITQPTKLTASASVASITCNPGTNGSITLTAIGGTPAYTYAIGATSFTSNNIFPNLSAGSYTMHVKDAKGCIIDTTVIVLQPATITATVLPTNILCNGMNTGALAITASGGTPSFTYAIGGNAYSGTNTFSNLVAGTYTLHIKDANGCIKDTTTILTQPTKLTTSITSTTIPCYNTTNGSISITANGGIPGYTYAIGSGSYTPLNTFVNLSAGTYPLHVMDANSCIKDTSITLVQDPAIIPSLSSTPALCYGAANGTANISATGGTPAYTYALGSGNYGTTTTFTALNSGTYVIHTKDAIGCIKDTTMFISQPAAIITYAITVSPSACSGPAIGSINISATGGVPGYTYALGNAPYSATHFFNNLFAGTYVLHIKDASGCIKDTVIPLLQPAPLSSNIAITKPLCAGMYNGSINVTATGGTPAYTYAISTGAFSTNHIFTNIVAGNYTIHIKDANGCPFDTTFAVTQPGIIVPHITVHNVHCYGGNDGSILVTANSGTPPYVYSLTGLSWVTNDTFHNLSAGSYVVYVRDTNGCQHDTLVYVDQPPPIIINGINTVAPLCYNSSNGSITVSASGGLGTLTYSVNSGAYTSSMILNGLTAGVNTIHVKDTSGCIRDSVVLLAAPTAIVPSAIVKASACDTVNNGKVTLFASGATPGYTFALGTASFSSNNIFPSLGAGTYTFHIKDTNGCTKDTSITVTDSTHISSNVNINNPLCYDQASGIVTIIPNNGTAPYQYAMGNAPFGSTNTFQNITAGTYTLHIKDAIGCVNDTTISVTQPALIIPAVNIFVPTCYGASNASFTVIAAGGTPPYQYAVDLGTFSANNTFSSFNAGTYTIHIRDAHSCLHDTTISITQPSKVAINTISITSPLCYGDTNGIVVVTASGGSPAYSFSYDTHTFTSVNSFIHLSAGLHIIYVKDSYGCLADSNIIIIQPIQVHLTATTIIAPGCQGGNTGEIIFTGTGGTLPYQYSNDNMHFSSSDIFQHLAIGTDTFYVIDAHNCKYDTAISLIIAPPIIMDSVIVTPLTCYAYTDAAISIYTHGGTLPFQYSLNGNTPVSSSTFTGLPAGHYGITITDFTQCSISDSITITEPDTMQLSIHSEANDCDGFMNISTVSVDVKGGKFPYTYLWSTVPASTNDTIMNVINGDYTIWVKDATGCSDSTTVTINYDNCCSVEVPNAFTPNHDGKNDVFRILYQGNMILKSFAIYDRFGQIMFQTTDKTHGWDGTFNGTLQDIGTYYYHIKVICGNAEGKLHQYKGDVTLIR